MSHEGSSRQARDRGVTRSKAEKARPPTQPVPQVDIVPGRLNEAEWIAFMALEEGEDVVGDILADLLARVMECAFKVYLTQQDPGNADQFLLGSPWPDGDSREPTDSSQPSVEPRANPDPAPVQEVFQEAEPGDALEDPDRQEEGHVSAGSPKAALHPSPGGTPAESPQPALERPRVASTQDSAEKGPPLSAHVSLEDLYHCTPQPDAAGDRLKRRTPEMPRAASSGSATVSSVLGPEEPVPPQPPDGQDVPPGRKSAVVRLDPARLPRHWVRPVAEVLIPDSQTRPLETYRGRPRGEKTQAGVRTPGPGSPARRSRADLKLHVPAPEYLSQSCAPFRALGPDPTLNLAQSSPTFGSKLPFLSPGFRFLATHPKHSEMVGSPSPKLWPRAKWPSGWEREAEQLGELWAGRTRVPPQGLEAADDEGIEDSEWPLTEPQILEATSQVLWKPMVSSETVKLAPGVSMWNRGTQELLSSAAAQEDAEGDPSQAAEQQPIQTGVSKPQVIMTQLIKKDTPKAWLLPAKPVPHSGS